MEKVDSEQLESQWQQLLADLVLRSSQSATGRKQDRSKKREQEIQRAALRVFARDGISRSRIQDIAAEAGMPVSTLYEYCSSKEELAYLVPMASLARFFSEYQAAVGKQTTAAGRLRVYLCLAADFARRNPEWARVLYLEIWPSVLVTESALRRTIDDYARVILFLIRQGEQLGEWAHIENPYEMATILNGSVNQTIITALLYRKPRNLAKATESIVDRTMSLLPRLEAGARATRRSRRKPLAA